MWVLLTTYNFSPVSPPNSQVALSKYRCSLCPHMNAQNVPQPCHLFLSSKLDSQSDSHPPAYPSECWQSVLLSTSQPCVLTPSWWPLGTICPPLELREHPGPPTFIPSDLVAEVPGEGEWLPRAQGSGAKVLFAGPVGSCTICPSQPASDSFIVSGFPLAAGPVPSSPVTCFSGKKAGAPPSPTLGWPGW